MEKKKNDSTQLIPPSYYKVDKATAIHQKQQAAHTMPALKEVQPATTDESPKVTIQPDTPLEVASPPKETTSRQEATTGDMANIPSTTPVAKPSATQGSPNTAAPKLDLRKEGVSGLSLKGLQKKKELEKQRAAVKVDVTNLPKEPFTEIAMQAIWQEYVNKLTKAGEKILASNLEADLPKLQGTAIHLEFPNETMKVEVERAQGPLLEFLKRKLNNYDISLVIHVNEEVQRKYAYTPQEKYEKLREQNPELDLLRKTFDLQL